MRSNEPDGSPIVEDDADAEDEEIETALLNQSILTEN